ncbi:MAG: hypothetical protein ABR985_03785 [Methanotrichaceae archaeon]
MEFKEWIISPIEPLKSERDGKSRKGPERDVNFLADLLEIMYKKNGWLVLDEIVR